MKIHLIVSGIVFVLLIVGLSGCYSDTEYTTDLPTEDDIQILSHDWNYTNYGNLIVRGNAKNIGETRISFVEIKAKFYNDKDILIDTSSTYMSDVDSGEIFEFEIMCLDDSTPSYYTIGIGSVW